MKTILQFLLFIFLTIITQIGGLVLLLTHGIHRKWNANRRIPFSLLFLGLYLLMTLLVIPLLAPIIGREPVEHSQQIRPTNYMTVLLNRNYVKSRLNEVLQKAANELANEGIQIRYLDANFPFIDEFPLLPHLSHDDGEKIDLSFVYVNKKGDVSNQQKSRSGYGVFENPKEGESNQPQECKAKGAFQYDFPKYLTFGSINKDIHFSEKHTKLLVQAFLKQKQVGKIFIEPHLKSRLNLTSNRVRYQGCHSVRHDDHIHVQLK